MSSHEWLSVSEDDGVAHIVFDRAPVNQFDEPFLRTTLDAVAALPPDTRAVVLSSAVDGTFAAGGDIPWMASAPIEQQLAFVELCQRTYSSFEQLACPAIVAIDGACLGGGLELALCCDVRVVGESAVLGLPEATIGLIAGAGGTQRLPRAIGQGLARDLLITGRRISGTEAGAIGLASRVVADRTATAAALALARRLADGPTEAIQASKRLALSAFDQPLDVGLAHELTAWEQVRRSPTSQEGLDAFAAKRRPDFRAAARRGRR